MSQPISGLGPNLSTYHSSLQGRIQSQQMGQVARLVARTLASAFHDVPFPVEGPKTKRERQLLRLRDEVAQMVAELESAVRDGGLEEVEWPNTEADHSLGKSPKRADKEEVDELSLSVRSRQLLRHASLQGELHPLEDEQAAQELAWLAQAQVLHQRILAFSAQANIDTELAQRVLDKPESEARREALSRRVEHIDQRQQLHQHPVTPHLSPSEQRRYQPPYTERPSADELIAHVKSPQEPSES